MDLLFFNVFIEEVTSSLVVGVIKKESLLGFFRNLEKSQFDLISFFSMFLAIEAKCLLNSSAISLRLLIVILLTFWMQFITLFPFLDILIISLIPCQVLNKFNFPHEKINRCLTDINRCLTDIFRI